MKARETIAQTEYESWSGPWEHASAKQRKTSLSFADDILSALDKAGFVCVEREPNDEVLKAVSEAFRLAWWSAENNSRRDAWRAMIKAATNPGA